MPRYAYSVSCKRPPGSGEADPGGLLFFWSGRPHCAAWERASLAMGRAEERQLSPVDYPNNMGTLALTYRQLLRQHHIHHLNDFQYRNSPLRHHAEGSSGNNWFKLLPNIEKECRKLAISCYKLHRLLERARNGTAFLSHYLLTTLIGLLA